MSLRKTLGFQAGLAILITVVGSLWGLTAGLVFASWQRGTHGELFWIVIPITVLAGGLGVCLGWDIGKKEERREAAGRMGILTVPQKGGAAIGKAVMAGDVMREIFKRTDQTLSLSCGHTIRVDGLPPGLRAHAIEAHSAPCVECARELANGKDEESS